MSLTLLSQASNGTTYDELRKGLHLNSDKAVVANKYQEFLGVLQKSAGQSELLIANRIYLQQELQINKHFQEVAEQKFYAKVESVDFTKKNETAHLINTFVEEKTKGNIKQIVTPKTFTPLPHVILVNSIYLRSIWLLPFPRRSTRKQKFYINETESIETDFMFMKRSIWHTTVDELDIAALRLDYANSSFSFIMLLPNKRTGLSALEAQLHNVNLSKIVDQTKYKQYEVNIPKFKIESEFSMNDILKKVCVDKKQMRKIKLFMK